MRGTCRLGEPCKIKKGSRFTHRTHSWLAGRPTSRGNGVAGGTIEPVPSVGRRGGRAAAGKKPETSSD